MRILASSLLWLVLLPLPAAAASVPELARSPWAPPPSSEAWHLGASVKLDGIVDSEQIYNDQAVFAAPAKTATPGGVASDNPDALHQSTNLSVRETLLSLEGTRELGSDWRVTGYGEINFVSYAGTGADPGSPSPILREAYAWLRPRQGGISFAFGELNGPFAPLDPVLLNGNALSYGGNVGARLPQLRGRYDLGPLSLEAAVLKPADMTVDLRPVVLDLVGKGQDSAIPELQARLSGRLPLGDLPYGARSLDAEAGLSGRFSQEAYGVGTTAEHRMNSWGVALDARAGFLDRAWLMGEAYRGSDLENVFGLGGIAGPLSNQAVIPTTAVSETGGWIGLGTRIFGGVSMQATYGLALPDATSFAKTGTSQSSGLDVTRNEVLALTTLWQVGAGTTLGLEILHINTGYVPPEQGGSRTAGSLDRLQLSAIQSF